MKNLSETQQMNYQIDRNSHSEASIIIAHVYKALKEKGYDPVNQIVGYILSGDPTYITGHNNARNLISKLERDELLEEIVDTYIKKTVGK